VNLESTQYDDKISKWTEEGYAPGMITYRLRLLKSVQANEDWSLRAVNDFVYSRLRKMDLPIFLSLRRLENLDAFKEAVKDKNFSLKDVAERFNLSYDVVSWYARTWGIRRKNILPPMDDEVLRQRYCVELWSTTKIERVYGRGYNQQRASRRLRELGLLKPDRQHRADRRERERGYRHLMSSGYPLAKIPEGHTTRNGKLDGTFGFAHVIEMEKKIGRPLLKSERVHHIDCDKMNFSIENLLLCGNDPVHQRLHSTLERVVGKLYKAGIVGFEPERGYYVKEEPSMIPDPIPKPGTWK